MSGEAGAIYAGHVVHKRARPKQHSLRYSVFSMLVDLDRLGELDRQLKLFSFNRFNLFSLFARDFGPHDGTSVAAFLRRRAAAAGISDAIVRIRMLAYPRMFGYAFNPLTVYYLDDAEGRIRMLVYEVHNTFGEHHFYQWVVPQAGQLELTHEIKKSFYVSPFNTLAGTYRFAVRSPGETVFTGITLADDQGGLVTAYFDGEKRPLSDALLIKLALAYPIMTAKVMVGIYREALLLWLKGVPLTLKGRQKLRRSQPARDSAE